MSNTETAAETTYTITLPNAEQVTAPFDGPTLTSHTLYQWLCERFPVAERAALGPTGTLKLWVHDESIRSMEPVIEILVQGGGWMGYREGREVNVFEGRAVVERD